MKHGFCDLWKGCIWKDTDIWISESYKSTNFFCSQAVLAHTGMSSRTSDSVGTHLAVFKHKVLGAVVVHSGQCWSTPGSGGRGTSVILALGMQCQEKICVWGWPDLQSEMEDSRDDTEKSFHGKKNDSVVENVWWPSSESMTQTFLISFQWECIICLRRWSQLLAFIIYLSKCSSSLSLKKKLW